MNCLFTQFLGWAHSLILSSIVFYCSLQWQSLFCPESLSEFTVVTQKSAHRGKAANQDSEVMALSHHSMTTLTGSEKTGWRLNLGFGGCKLVKIRV